MKLFLALSLLVSTASAVSFFEVVVEEWSTWKFMHGKNYTNDTEEKFRMKIFMENKAKIERHNRGYHSGDHTYSMKMNHYGDQLAHEFRTSMNGYRQDLRAKLGAMPNEMKATYISPMGVTVPETMDWRTKGAVTPVKNQGQCGSCWAFSTTGSLEAQHFRKTGKLTSLSEQNLVDCSRKEGNNGCEGGLMDLGFKYIKENGGIDTEESYPYEGVNDKCKYNPATKGAWDVGFVDIPSGSEDKLKEAIAAHGPCSIAIDAGQETFQFYHQGVYADENCHTQQLDHGVLAIGYGEEAGGKYWLVKNSWGESWGDQGYIKIARDHNNMCGVATQASYPLV